MSTTASLLAWLAAAVAGDCGDGPTVVVPAVKKGLSNQRMRIVQDVAMAQLLGYAVSLPRTLFSRNGCHYASDCYRDYDNGTDFWSVFDREQTLGALAAAGICVRDPPPDGADALAIPFRWPVAASDVARSRNCGARAQRSSAASASARGSDAFREGDVDEACVAHWRDEDDFVRSEHALDRGAHRRDVPSAVAVGDPAPRFASASEKFAKRLVRHTCAVGAERAPLAADELFDLREKKTKRGVDGRRSEASPRARPAGLSTAYGVAVAAAAAAAAGAGAAAEIFVWADGAAFDLGRRALRPFGENPRAALALEPHPQRNSSAEELDHCLEPEAPPRLRALRARLEAQRAAYGRVAGWSDDRGLYWAAFFAARRRPAASALFDAWWLEVRRWQYRDQISLPFAGGADPPLATFRAFGEAPPRPLPREQALCATLVGDVTRCCRRCARRHREARRAGCSTPLRSKSRS
ncbi:hypothetical protein JL721_6428 [Aureococcus anophagefferens]|nr:hypothetical protein JL721_6428 [Aureococcus anophagefferens]